MSKTATAVIVVNNEQQQRFIMAGDASLPATQSLEMKPVVMVSGSDGEDLIQLARKYKYSAITLARQDNREIFLRGKKPDAQGITFNSLVPYPEGEQGEDQDLHNLRWPVVQTEPNAVQVLSKGRSWGVRLVRLQGPDADTGEVEWQLFIIKA